MKIFSTRLKSTRVSKEITQHQLARQIGVTIRTIVNYENNSREPSFEQLAIIAKYLSVSTDYLLGLNDE